MLENKFMINEIITCQILVLGNKMTWSGHAAYTDEKVANLLKLNEGLQIFHFFTLQVHYCSSLDSGLHLTSLGHLLNLIPHHLQHWEYVQEVSRGFDCCEMPMHLRRELVALTFYLKLQVLNYNQSAIYILNDCNWSNGKTLCGQGIQKFERLHQVHIVDVSNPMYPIQSSPWCLHKPATCADLTALVTKTYE